MLNKRVRYFVDVDLKVIRNGSIIHLFCCSIYYAKSSVIIFAGQSDAFFSCGTRTLFIDYVNTDIPHKTKNFQEKMSCHNTLNEQGTTTNHAS